jgi:signal transduction histidine kinase/ActR/RegA family two-component response regulator
MLSGRALASAPDLDQAVEIIQRLAVPRLASAAEIAICTPEGTFRSEPCIVHADKNLEIMLKHMRRCYPVTDPHHPLREVLRSGQSRRFELTAEMVARVANDPEHRQMIEACGVRSLIIVPLRSRHETFGGLTFGASHRSFTADDVTWLEGVGQSVAIAIDNAMLLKMAETERRRADEANQARDDFLGMVSHELRTPLTAILGWARMLRTGSLSDGQREKALTVIERNVFAQTRIIDDLLDANHIITGKIRLRVGAVDMIQVMEAAVNSIRLAAEAKHLRLHSSLDPDASALMGDADRIQQIVRNLLSNAVKFTPAAGSIDVRLSRGSTHVELAVEDTGMGIPAEFLPFVFDGFRQADAGTTRSYGGLGLGLAIVRNLVELHGGTVRARSAGMGQGATFVVRLPAAGIRSSSHPPPDTEDRASPEPSVAPAAANPAEDLHVLVVEDDPDARDLLAAVLEHGGLKVRTATTVAEALILLPAFRPDVLVADIGMPLEDGYALMRKVRALPPEQGGCTPAVALTAYARSEDRAMALSAGFDMHVPKPIDPVELLLTVTNLGRPGANR